jgi:DNA-binding transcriptional LysR family regulator
MNNRDHFVLESRIGVPRNMDLTALHIFKTVAEEGGITRAAAKLHRVQSNVTTRVRQLEERLGTRLFLRENRKLVLSPEGKVLLGYADQMLRLSSEAQTALRKGTPRGTLRVGTMESTAATRLPPVLSRYHLAYPDVRIELITGTSGALVAKVAAYELEAAFVADPAQPERFDSQPAFKEELVLIAPKSLAPITSPRQIADHTVIAFGTGCTYRRRLEDWLKRADARPRGVMEFHSYHAIVACVASGAGLAIVPRAVISAVLGRKQVQIYPLPAHIAKAKTVLIWRKGHLSTALEALGRQLTRIPR